MNFLKNIIVCGDIHGDWGPLNTLINKKRPDIILQTGDFGWWPRVFDRNVNEGVKTKNTELFFCPGNHEDWDELSLRRAEPAHLYDNVYYMRRGSTLTLPDGRVVLFMGGGLSIDKEIRTIGLDWFPQELIPYAEFYKLQEKGIEKIDIVISHTCPNEFNVEIDAQLRKLSQYAFRTIKFKDCSQEVLSAILEEYKPSLWYFGHFHVEAEGVHENTKWYALDYPRHGKRWWRYLDNA